MAQPVSPLSKAALLFLAILLYHDLSVSIVLFGSTSPAPAPAPFLKMLEQ